jgi:hypothetical protein
MDRLVQIVGVGIVALTLIDIYLTVLYPSLTSSLVSLPLCKGIWQLFRLTASAMPFNRDQVLSHCGPITIIAIIVLWVSLLLCGFALISWPELGSSIKASQEQTPTDFATALYYSGYALTTLGSGDILPKTSVHRLLILLQAAIGFSIFTLTITYILAVYSALAIRNTFALSLHYRTASTGDAVELLTRLGASGEFNDSRQEIADIARELINLLEAQHSYPVLLYFRFRQTLYAMPRILFLAMDSATLIKSALNCEKNRPLIHSTAVAELWGSGLQLVIELSRSLVPKGRSTINEQREKLWRERYYQAVERLRAEGIETVTDLEEGANLYISLRGKWEPALARLTDYMAYKWGEIAVGE